MTDQEKDRIECAIRHIKTAVDIDPWAVEMAVDALEKQIPRQIKEIHVDEYYCPSCGSENNAEQGVVWDLYCPQCGQALKMYEGEI